MTSGTKFIGLTGGIGMGKTTVATMLREKGFPVWSADEAVHKMYRKGGVAVETVSALFPETLVDGAIDRALLGKVISGNLAKRAALEAIVHPLVNDEEVMFRKRAQKMGEAFAFLEIPLLFETGAEKRCDFTFCVSASAQAQKERVLPRKGMTEDLLAGILERQMPDVERCRRANFVVLTSGTIDETRAALDAALAKIGASPLK